MASGLILGLTGPSGSGKSTVCRLLSRQYPQIGYIDADLVARQVVEPGKPCLQALVEAFSPYLSGPLLTERGELNRRKLGELVFTDGGQLERLNQTIFPYIREELAQQLSRLTEEYRLVVLDAPTLFESGADGLCQRIVSVLSPYSLRLERICRRDGLTREQAKHRLDSQHPDSFYRSRSHYVLQNRGNLRETSAQLEELLCRLGLASGWNRNRGWSQRRLPL